LALAALTGRRQPQKPFATILLALWAGACLVAGATCAFWPLQVPSATRAGWLVAALMVEFALILALWLLKSDGLERLLDNCSTTILQRPLRLALLPATVLFAALASGHFSQWSAARHNAERPNIILITLDTLRADHMGLYGHHLKTTPELDAFGESAAVFTSCISTAPYTAPAFWSMMTSKYRTAHSVGTPGAPKIIPNQQTLARVLSKNGYATAAFVSNSVLHRKRRFWQGFDLYDDSYTSFTFSGGVIERTADKANEYVFNWLDTVGDRRFFLWLHYQDPHGPYVPPDPYLRRLPERIGAGAPQSLPMTDNDGRSGIPMYQYIPGQSSPSYYRLRYSGEIAYADDLIGDFLERVKQLGLWEKSVIIFTADHGESMGEHNYYFCHGHDLTEELIHVPLIVHAPGVTSGQRVDELVSIIDLAPTILAAVGLEGELDGSGMNLMPLLRGSERRLDREHVIAEDLSNRLCLRSRGMKYISGPDGERLYDLTADPDELVNLLDERPELAGEWRAAAERYRRQEKPQAGAAKDAPRDLENLRNLGYIN
jgi:arylsulfatase